MMVRNEIHSRETEEAEKEFCFWQYYRQKKMSRK